MRDFIENTPAILRFAFYALLLFILMAVDSCYGQEPCDNILDFLSEYGTCESGCICDFDQNGSVDTMDLLQFISDYPSPPEALDIEPKWNPFYNEAGGGNDGFDLFPVIHNSELTWDDIKDDCQVLWLINGQVFYEGYDMAFNETDLSVLCSGAFPCTVRIIHQGFTYERTEPTWLQIFFSEADDCDFGLSFLDADIAGVEMSFGTALPFEYCTNCE